MFDIASIFLPDHINQYYLFKKTIIGIEIGKHTIYATVVSAKGKKRTIKQFIEEPIIHDPEKSADESTINALKKLQKKIGSYDSIYTTISSKYIFYKQLTVPFLDRDKIALMLPFEIEQSLPFKLAQGIIDFIVLKKNQEKKESTVLVAATKIQHVESQIELFKKAGYSLEKVSVDLLELCSLYSAIETYSKTKGLIALIDIAIDSTRIALISDGTVQALRVIPQGIETITNDEFTPQELSRLDLEEIPPKIKKRAEQFFAKIMFTLEAIQKNLNITKEIDTLLLTGAGAEISGIKKLVCSLTEKNCSVLLAHKIMQDSNITIEKKRTIPGRFVTSLATALHLPLTQNYNLTASFESEEENSKLKKQIIVAGILLATILVGYGSYTYITRRSLKKSIEQAEKETITKLKKVFGVKNKQLKSAKTVTTANRAAQKELKKEESIWYSLSTHNRFSFLKYLQELTTRINKEDLGLELKRLVLKSGRQSNQDTLLLQGSVRDYDALRNFEKALQESELFENVPKLQEPTFSLNLKLAAKDFDR